MESHSAEEVAVLDVPRSHPTLRVRVRLGTTDENVFREIFHKRVYRKPKANFDVSAGEKWIDIGAHVGMFALYAIANKASAVWCYEPELDNFAALEQNIVINGLQARIHPTRKAVVAACDEEHANLYLARRKGNNYRHTTVPVRGRETQRVSQTQFQSVLDEHADATGVKIDIEGAEVDILTDDSVNWRSVRKICFEYTVKSFSLSRIKACLEGHGFELHYPPCLMKTYDKKRGVAFPDSVLFATRDK
jgi:FkbM family methyltransferase